MSEEFKGNVPEIVIEESMGGLFTYRCKKHNKSMTFPCSSALVVYEDCYDCLGFNEKFIRLFRKKSKCTICTTGLDYGYFMLIYLLEKAGLLPKKFRMLCCVCKAKEQAEKKI